MKSARAAVLAEYPNAYATLARTWEGLEVWLVCDASAPDGVGWFVWGGTQEEAWARVAAAIAEYRTLPKKDG